MPTARSSWPIALPVERDRSVLAVAPRAMLPGKPVAGAGRRTMRPPSWSVLMNNGMAGAWAAPAAWIAFDSVAIWLAETRFPVTLK